MVDLQQRLFFYFAEFVLRISFRGASDTSLVGTSDQIDVSQHSRDVSHQTHTPRRNIRHTAFRRGARSAPFAVLSYKDTNTLHGHSLIHSPIHSPSTKAQLSFETCCSHAELARTSLRSLMIAVLLSATLYHSMLRAGRGECTLHTFQR